MTDEQKRIIKNNPKVNTDAFLGGLGNGILITNHVLIHVYPEDTEHLSDTELTEYIRTKLIERLTNDLYNC